MTGLAYMGAADGAEHSTLDIAGRTLYLEARPATGRQPRSISIAVGRDVVAGHEADLVTRRVLSLMDADEHVPTPARARLRHAIVMALYGGAS